MNLDDAIISGTEKISLVGLGYVGMPIAVAFAKKVRVIGFDLNAKKIEQYKAGIDLTNEVGNEVIAHTTVDFTADETRLREAKFHIVAVPTPVNDDHTPDLSPLEGASAILGRNLTAGSIVVFESTVYPGVTEDVCVPILERESGLKCGVDFKVGYSPERINPGDKVHRLETIVKIVSGMDAETLDTVAKVYELVVEAGVHRAESIKVAEAAKVMLEAGAIGRPLLASNVAGHTEILEDGINGITFLPHDVDSLVQAIEKFLNLPYERKKRWA